MIGALKEMSRKMDQKEKYSKEVEVNLLPLLKELSRRLWLMVLVGVILAGVAFVGVKLTIKPVYRSGFTAYVNNQQMQNSKDVLTNSDISASKELVRTYSQIIRSNTILGAAAKTISLDLNYSSLKAMVTTEIQNETEIISVYVVHTDPQIAYDYANAIAKTAPSYMADIVEGSSMKIIDYPEYTDVPFGPGYFKYALVAFLGGFLIVALIGIIRYFKDDTVKSEGDIEAQFALPVLGVIPDINATEQKSAGYSDGRYGYGYGGYEYGYAAKRSERKSKHENK